MFFSSIIIGFFYEANRNRQGKLRQTEKRLSQFDFLPFVLITDLSVIKDCGICCFFIHSYETVQLNTSSLLQLLSL